LSSKRLAVTGMAVNTPLGDSLEVFRDALLAGRSALTRWRSFADEPIYSKVGADLSGYDVGAAVAALEGRLPPEMHRRLRHLAGRVPWSTQLSMLLAAHAWLDAGLAPDPAGEERAAVLVAGHNINGNYSHRNRQEFVREPDFIDGMYSLHALDTDHAGCVSEVLQARGPIYTMGAACASGNLALRAAVDEIRYHDVERVFVVGAVFDFSPLDLHAMALMGAISWESFNEDPAAASRPFDVHREGFIPAHGGGVLVLEGLESARRRGARIHAEILAVEASADGCHLPQPSQEGQVRAMRHALAQARLRPEQIDFISAHATSTPLGDLTEILSIKEVFGPHAYRLKINAPKSLFGHTCWSAPVVEAVAAILQMNAGLLHPSINIDELDPAVDLDVCRGERVAHPVRCFMKNSFGFGGINGVSVFARCEGGRREDG
jgi:3-oxoacyl-(acyl-carrier-protein) synthase